MLPLQEIKQIAGRAGRYGTQYADGVVTCMSPEDLKCVRKGMQVADQPVLKAGILILLIILIMPVPPHVCHPRHPSLTLSISIPRPLPFYRAITAPKRPRKS